MRAHLSLLLVLFLPLLPCFSLLAMVRFSSSPSSILRFQAQPKLGPLLVTLVSGRLTESLESVEDLETGEKGRKVELEEEEGEGREINHHGKSITVGGKQDADTKPHVEGVSST